MDTATVLLIIGMLNTRIYHINLGYLDNDQFDAEWVLINFRDHLQEYIESQVSALENSTGE